MGDGTITAQVGGLDGLEQKLNNLAPKAARGAIRKAARQAGKTWQEQESISVRTSAGAGEEEGTTGSVTVSVGPTKPGFYMLWQEFGSIHQPAKPVLQPVFDETAGQVLDAFIENLNEVLEGLAE